MMPSTVKAGMISSGDRSLAYRNPMPSAASTTPACTDQRIRPNGALGPWLRPGAAGRELEKFRPAGVWHVSQQILVRLHAIEDLRVDVYLHARLSYPSAVVHHLAGHGAHEHEERHEGDEQSRSGQNGRQRLPAGSGLFGCPAFPKKYVGFRAISGCCLRKRLQRWIWVQVVGPIDERRVVLQHPRTPGAAATSIC